MAQLLEYIKMAFDNIKSNKGRSILTMLGIIIGISSVIMIISIGDGVKKQFSDDLNSFAGGQIVVYTNDTTGDGAYNITLEDIEAIKEKVEHVKGASIQNNFSGNILTGKGSFDAMVTCGMADLKYLSSDKIKRGSFFTESDYYSANKVCVINSASAIQMFGTDDVVGMTIELTIYGVTQELTIVGIEEVSEGALLNFSYGNGVIPLKVPTTVMESYYGFWFKTFNYVYLVAEEPQYSKEVATSVINLLEARHQCRGENIYLLEDFNDQMGEIMNMINMITYFIVFVAAISLLVGGIGVMNIMLVSVTERTREIGIRKSLGARTGSIMLQFLSESAIITMFGGIIGIVLGILGAKGVCSLVGVAPGISVSTILFATLFSSGVGIFFGIYPAKKAAKMNPIEALRFN